MAKEALTYQVTDYLVKLELTADTLSEAIERVLAAIRRIEERDGAASTAVYPFYDKFFIRLLNNLFESRSSLRCRAGI